MDERLDTAPCGLLSFTDAGIIRSINLTLLQMLGYAREELAGVHVERILTIGSRIFYQTHWFPLLRLHGRAEEIFLMLRAKSGEDVGVLVNARRWERGGEIEYDCVLIRVHERQKYEDELLRARRTADQARAEMEARQEEIQEINEQLEAQALELGFQQEQLQDQAAALEAASEELQAINDDLLMRNDEAEQLRAAAEEANQAKSTFLAVMSHELRTPLNAIGGYIQILEMGIHGPVTDAQRETLERIDRSQRHLLRLINEVLNLARIEAGHVDYAITEVSIAEIVAAVTPMVEPQLELKGVGFAAEVETELRVRADPEKVEQILLNLMNNAMKFTPGGGQVRVEATRSPEDRNQLLLRVRDTGIGISPEKVNAVFEPFVQVDSSRTRGQEGTGLGLAISRDLARGMEGELTAESELGKGSVFTLRLPLAS